MLKYTNQELDALLDKIEWKDSFKLLDEEYLEKCKQINNPDLWLALMWRNLQRSQKDRIIDVKDVSNVYAGKAGHCCCGCSGKHTYASAYKTIVEKSHGRKIKNEEINDKTVKRVVNIINRTNVKDHDKHVSDKMVSVVIRKRLYCAYMDK